MSVIETSDGLLITPFDPEFAAALAKRAAPAPAPCDRPAKARKLTFKESAELAAIPDRIDAAEGERERLFAALGDPAVLRDGGAVVEAKAKLAAIEAELGALLERREALETIAVEAESYVANGSTTRTSP